MGAGRVRDGPPVRRHAVLDLLRVSQYHFRARAPRVRRRAPRAACHPGAQCAHDDANGSWIRWSGDEPPKRKKPSETALSRRTPCCCPCVRGIARSASRIRGAPPAMAGTSCGCAGTSTRPTPASTGTTSRGAPTWPRTSGGGAPATSTIAAATTTRRTRACGTRPSACGTRRECSPRSKMCNEPPR